MWKSEKFSLSPKNISSNQLFNNLKNRYFHRIFVKNAWERIPIISNLWIFLPLIFYVISFSVNWKLQKKKKKKKKRLPFWKFQTTEFWVGIIQQQNPYRLKLSKDHSIRNKWKKNYQISTLRNKNSYTFHFLEECWSILQCDFTIIVIKRLVFKSSRIRT